MTLMDTVKWKEQYVRYKALFLFLKESSCMKKGQKRASALIYTHIPRVDEFPSFSQPRPNNSAYLKISNRFPDFFHTECLMIT